MHESGIGTKLTMIANAAMSASMRRGLASPLGNWKRLSESNPCLRGDPKPPKSKPEEALPKGDGLGAGGPGVGVVLRCEEEAPHAPSWKMTSFEKTLFITATTLVAGRGRRDAVRLAAQAAIG